MELEVLVVVSLNTRHWYKTKAQKPVMLLNNLISKVHGAKHSQKIIMLAVIKHFLRSMLKMILTKLKNFHRDWQIILKSC